MVKSMTGFGRASREIDGYMITVELKSVNHRYFEFLCRCPRQYGFIDDKIKSFVNSKVARGKIECYVGIEALNTESADVVVNNTLANAYVKALKEISTNYDLKEDFGASTIARFPDVLIVRKSEEDEEKIWQLVKTVANEAVEKFIDMRKVEGKKMYDDVYSRSQFILDTVFQAGPNPCPPMVVGVGIGGTFERAAQLAKKATFRPIDSKNEDERYAQLEDELLTEINKMGFGPAGLGGNTTAIGVNIETSPTHIAGMPVAVNICCHAARHASATI